MILLPFADYPKSAATGDGAAFKGAQGWGDAQLRRGFNP